MTEDQETERDAPGDGAPEYIVYVDESGDHGLESIDPQYPVFVLAFCIFEIEAYVEQVVPSLQRFKFREFGHDGVVLHEREIRKELGQFAHLKPRSRKTRFLKTLTRIVDEAPFQVIAAVIRKEQLQSQYAYPANPYDLALGFCLERLHYFLSRRGYGHQETHIMFERRGRSEDEGLRAKFDAVCGGDNPAGSQLSFVPHFLDKKVNSCGLQLADLVARPIGLSVLRPGQPNRAFEIIEKKLDCSPNGDFHGWGLKVFP